MCGPFGPKKLTMVMPDDVEGHYHVTSASLPVIPTNSVDKIVDKELRSKTTARYFISIQVRYSLVRFGT